MTVFLEVISEKYLVLLWDFLGRPLRMRCIELLFNRVIAVLVYYEKRKILKHGRLLESRFND